jgi:hypothetical protein
VLPSRPTLRGWNPDSLTAAAATLQTKGQDVYGAVRGVDDGVDRLPDSRTWSGRSHSAATAMFHRATVKASGFADYTEKVSAALQSGSGSIGSARTALLSHADDVDKGELSVSDSWVVLIKPQRVSAEKATALQEAAKAEQAEINRLLVAVGDADSATASKVQAAADGHGFAMPGRDDPRMLDPNSGFAPPANQVPDPMTLDGLIQQGIVRDSDMAQTVRDSHEWTTEDGQKRKMVYMMDGSRHEIWEWGSYDPSVDDEYYDKHGNLVSSTFSQDRYDGSKFTSIKFADGTEVDMTQTADGKSTGKVIAADGRQGDLPDEFFTHPALTTVGGALTGIEKQAEHGIPMLSANAVDNVGKVAKYGGPTLGVATALYDTVTAQTFHDGCVAAMSGAAGIGGGYVGTALGTAAGAMAENPVLASVLAGGGNVLGTWTFGYMGAVIGNVVCPS